LDLWIKGSLEPKKRLLRFKKPFFVTNDSTKEDSLEPKEGSEEPSFGAKGSSKQDSLVPKEGSSESKEGSVDPEEPFFMPKGTPKEDSLVPKEALRIQEALLWCQRALPRKAPLNSKKAPRNLKSQGKMMNG